MRDFETTPNKSMPLIALLCFAVLSSTGLSATGSVIVPLYPEGAVPNYRDVGESEIRERANILRISKVQTPTLEVFLPDPSIATGDAIIICPGGGYAMLAYEHEGTAVAQWWAERGVAGLVLKYRLPTSDAQIEPRLSPLLDAQRALRLTRHHAADWRINPNRVGIMGFSAGGHLAASASVHYDAGDANATDPIKQRSSRPDFSMLIYPVISFTEPFRHSGSRRNLIGNDASPSLVAHYSTERQVTADTPPAILIHAQDDRSVPVENSFVYAEALRRHDILNEIVVYPEGGHGFGLRSEPNVIRDWIDRCAVWLTATRSP